MNELRNENDPTLTTADLLNTGRNRTDSPVTPRQAYASAKSTAVVDPVDPVDYRGPDDYRAPDRGGPSLVPPAAPISTAESTVPLDNQRIQPVPLADTPKPMSNSVESLTGNKPGPLFPDDELHNFRARWDQVQTSFVDEPRKAVEDADSLVANVVKRIAEQFANERETMEKQWDRGDDVNTEDLRQALKRYRAFFDRLLAF